MNFEPLVSMSSKAALSMLSCSSDIGDSSAAGASSFFTTAPGGASSAGGSPAAGAAGASPVAGAAASTFASTFESASVIFFCSYEVLDFTLTTLTNLHVCHNWHNMQRHACKAWPSSSDSVPKVSLICAGVASWRDAPLPMMAVWFSDDPTGRVRSLSLEPNHRSHWKS